MPRFLTLRIIPCVLVLGAASAQSVYADVKLPAVIGSHMVLQRDKPLPIWGWAAPGEDVTVTFDDHAVAAKADDKGNWKVTLPAKKADGKGHKLTVVGKNK